MSKPGQKIAMISSTSIDLPQHRQEAIDACLRQDVFPIAMEHLPARDADAIRVSSEMVDKADIYIGVYGWRYGHVPRGHTISITEMEFKRAAQRKIPIFVFLIDKDHPLKIEMVETDKASQRKLNRFKALASKGRGIRWFRSPEGLRAEVIQALSTFKQQERNQGDLSGSTQSTNELKPDNQEPDQAQTPESQPTSIIESPAWARAFAKLNEDFERSLIHNPELHDRAMVVCREQLDRLLEVNTKINKGRGIEKRWPDIPGLDCYAFQHRRHGS
jgi:hypothetical protein